MYKTYRVFLFSKTQTITSVLKVPLNSNQSIWCGGCVIGLVVLGRIHVAVWVFIMCVGFSAFFGYFDGFQSVLGKEAGSWKRPTFGTSRRLVSAMCGRFVSCVKCSDISRRFVFGVMCLCKVLTGFEICMSCNNPTGNVHVMTAVKAFASLVTKPCCFRPCFVPLRYE